MFTSFFSPFNHLSPFCCAIFQQSATSLLTTHVIPDHRGYSLGWLMSCVCLCRSWTSTAWITSWLPSWCPTSQNQLKTAEEKMLQCKEFLSPLPSNCISIHGQFVDYYVWIRLIPRHHRQGVPAVCPNLGW